MIKKWYDLLTLVIDTNRIVHCKGLKKYKTDEIVHCATVCNVKFDSNSSCDDIWVIL